MALNVIETKQVFQKELDKQMMEGLTSSFMDANAGKIIYHGGSEVKIPKVDMSGLKDYDRTKGYPDGAVSLSYETRNMKMDRGAGFQLDSMDVDDSNFVASAGMVLGEFQRVKVIPEVDAYRYSTIVRIADENKVTEAYTEKNIFKLISADIASAQDVVGESTKLVCCINGKARGILNASTEFNKGVNVADFVKGDVKTKIRAINEVPLISVPSDRMWSEYTFVKGSESDVGDKGGFSKKESAKQIDWIIMPMAAAIAVCKQDKGKIIDPDANQKADAWFVGYRKYHDVWVMDTQKSAIIPHFSS